MQSLYEQFLAVGQVHSLITGKEFSGYSGRPLQKKENTLNDAFQTQQADTSYKRLKQLERIVSESSIGASLLDTAKKNNISIRLDDSIKDCCGFYQPDKRAIILNAAQDNNVLASTMVHEARHVWQGLQPLAFDVDLQVKPLFMMGFALEADAVATETMFAFDLKKTHPEIWDSLKKSHYGKVADAFEEGIKASNRMSKGLNDAFLAWYETPVVSSYAGDYLAALKCCSENQYGEERSFLSKDVPAEQIAKTLCKFGKDVYLNEPSILESPEKLHMTPKQKNELDTLLTNWANRTFRSADVGSDAIFVKERDGSYSAGKVLAEKTSKQSPLWMQKLKTAGRV